MAWSCDSYKEWIEEEVEEPVKKRKKDARKRCKKKKCRKRCLCCNKWRCWVETFFYWVTEWVVRIVGKWFVYSVCRTVSAGITALFSLGRFFAVVTWLPKLLWCSLWGEKDNRRLMQMRLQAEVVIIDSSKEQNPVQQAEIDHWFQSADRILNERAKIRVVQRGNTRHTVSDSLYRISDDRVGEWIKALINLPGRDHPRYLTVYVVRNIEGTWGLHQPFFGSVFVQPGAPGTSLCHEFGHSMLIFNNFWKGGHSSRPDRLMYTPAEDREIAANWDVSTPTLSRLEKCAMRSSRWLDWSWVSFVV